jgi:hypothetical protein
MSLFDDCLQHHRPLSTKLLNENNKTYHTVGTIPKSFKKFQIAEITAKIATFW